MWILKLPSNWSKNRIIACHCASSFSASSFPCLFFLIYSFTFPPVISSSFLISISPPLLCFLFFFFKFLLSPSPFCAPTAKLEPRPPRYLRFIDPSQLDTHPSGRTALNGWWTRRTDRYLHNTTTNTTEENPWPSGIRNSYLNNRALSHWGQPFLPFTSLILIHFSPITILFLARPFCSCTL